MSSPVMFAALLALMSVGVFTIVLRPLWRTRPLPAATLIALLTAGSALLYRTLGTPAALDPTSVRRPETIEEAIAQLERSSAEFPDHEGWVLLATAYARIGEPTKARDAWDKAIAMSPDNADLLVAAAEARAQAHPSRLFDAHAVELLERALKRAPKHPRGRLFLGVALRQQRKPAEATALWEPLLAEMAPEEAVTLREQIDAARRDAGLPPLPPPAPTPAASGAALTVQVALDPDFAARARLRGDATVFVIARVPDGPPMPVAVEKHTVADLPLTVTLDDGDSPMPNVKLSTLKTVEVIARLSESGNAMDRAGNIDSAPTRVELPAKAPLALKIGAAPTP